MDWIDVAEGQQQMTKHDQERVDIDAYLEEQATASTVAPTANVPGSNDVTFTQYLRPNGRRQPVWIERSPEVAAMAKRVREAGYHFDIEMLMTGHISMTVEPNVPDADGDDPPIAHEICANGPAVLNHVDKLVKHALAHVEGR